MADEITEGTPTEGTTTGNGYLTKPYLVRNLQTFWGKIKKYITDQKFADQSYVAGAIDNSINDKVSQSELTEFLASKVDKVEGKGLSDNNFTNVLRDKLVALPASVATSSNMGFMSGDDRQQLDRLVDEAITEVDTALSDTSTRPVQNKVITEALNNKADAETLDPLEILEKYDLDWVESNTGNIILRPRNTIKHVKLHTENGEVIEKFYISGTNNVIFDTFKNTDRDIIIPNPDGTEKPSNAVYKFYVECLEFSDSGKYKPFILRVKRDGENPMTLTLSVFESQ